MKKQRTSLLRLSGFRLCLVLLLLTVLALSSIAFLMYANQKGNDVESWNYLMKSLLYLAGAYLCLIVGAIAWLLLLHVVPFFVEKMENPSKYSY